MHIRTTFTFAATLGRWGSVDRVRRADRRGRRQRAGHDLDAILDHDGDRPGLAEPAGQLEHVQRRG